MNKILEVASIPRVLANNSLGHRVSMNVCQKMTLERKKQFNHRKPLYNRIMCFSFTP